MSADPPADGRWEGDDIAAWQRRWNVPRLRILPVTASTNDEARALARIGAPAGTVVIADHQSAGRGREGRRWLDAPGESLLLSIVLRPELRDHRMSAGPAPIRVGLAACAAIERVAGIDVRLKWPNDILAPDGRKLAGILCEAVAGPDPFVVAGVGVNIRQHDSAWPPGLAGRVTSLLALGAATPRPDVAGAVIEALRPFTPGDAELDHAELDTFRRRDALRGRDVAIDGSPAGTAAGIRADGALVIRSDTGLRTVHSGTVRTLAPLDASDDYASDYSATGTRSRP